MVGGSPTVHTIAADVKIVVMLLVLTNRTGHTNSSDSVNQLLSWQKRGKCVAEQYKLKFLLSMCYFIGLLVVLVWGTSTEPAGILFRPD